MLEQSPNKNITEQNVMSSQRREHSLLAGSLRDQAASAGGDWRGEGSAEAANHVNCRVCVACGQKSHQGSWEWGSKKLSQGGLMPS